LGRERLEIATHAWVCVLADDQRRARVMDEHRRETFVRSTCANELRNFLRNVIGASAFGRDVEVGSVEHRGWYTPWVIRRSLRYAEELTDTVKHQLALAYSAKDLVAYGLRQKLREGYTRSDFRADLMAALVVGVVAL